MNYSLDKGTIVRLSEIAYMKNTLAGRVKLDTSCFRHLTSVFGLLLWSTN